VYDKHGALGEILTNSSVFGQAVSLAVHRGSSELQHAPSEYIAQNESITITRWYVHSHGLQVMGHPSEGLGKTVHPHVSQVANQFCPHKMGKLLKYELNEKKTLYLKSTDNEKQAITMIRRKFSNYFIVIYCAKCYYSYVDNVVVKRLRKWQVVKCYLLNY